MPPMIEIRHLRKEYGKTVALENLCLEVPEGEVLGLIGPNGAGKTTLIRILATLLEPTYGEVRIGGVDVLAAPLDVHPIMGYMSDFFSLYDDMLVWEYLDHFAGCYRIPRARRGELIDHALELVSLEVRRDAKIKSLSRGMRQRLCFAKTLIHQPKVLLLDEPASGLDPAGRIEFREIINKLREMGRTMIVSSHILTEMADFCTSVAIVEQGKLLAAGRIEHIQQQLMPRLRLEIEVLGENDALAALLGDHPSVARVAANNGRVLCDWTASRDELPELHRQIVARGIDLVSLNVQTSGLEDLYMRISGHRTS